MGLPAPRVWANGEEPENIPTADDLNLDWRDSFDFLLGNARPLIFVYSTSGQSLSGTPAAITWTNEVVKRGNMVHSTVTNSQNITVPYTGWYAGFCMGGFGTFSTATTKATVRLLNGSTIVALAHMPPPTTAGLEFVMSFTTYAVANDVYTMTQAVSSGTTCTASTAQVNRPRMAMWFAGDG
jgi:hypothetical protein